MQEPDRPLQRRLGLNRHRASQIGDGPHQNHFADQQDLQWIQSEHRKYIQQDCIWQPTIGLRRSQSNPSSEIPSYLFDLTAINLAQHHTTPRGSKRASLVILVAAGQTRHHTSANDPFESENRKSVTAGVICTARCGFP